MALQGTLETFSLPDVLQLLSSTKKSGSLQVTGERGDGSVWLQDGAIVGGTVNAAAGAAEATEVVFELLRFETGEFVFEDGVDIPDAGSPVEVGAALDEAGRMLDEWKEIEAVVPSSAHWVSLTAELPGEETTIAADRWRAVVAIASGCSVAGLGGALSLGELPVARLVKSLAEQGLVTVGEPQAGTPEPQAAPEPQVAPEPEPEPEPEPVVAQDEPAAAPAGEDYEPFDPDALVIDREPALSVVDPEVTAEPEVASEPEPALADAPTVPEPGEAAEIARQLANLSPKAARAVAAAAKATTPEEREAALAEVEASDEQINRDLLLKFLGTVN